MALHNLRDVYFYVIDNTEGKSFGTLAEAAAEFNTPNRTGEKILVRSEVVRKKVLVTSEQEVS